MVAVSSTVIPLQLFGKPKPLQGGRATARPRSHTAASSYLTPARRMRLLERSRRPDEPVRLITKSEISKLIKLWHEGNIILILWDLFFCLRFETERLEQ